MFALVALGPSLTLGAPTDLGLVSIEADATDPEQDCNLLAEGCLVAVDDNGTSDLGDDRIEAERAWRAIVVAAHPALIPLIGGDLAPLLPDDPASFDPRSVAVYFPVVDVAGRADEHLVDPLGVEETWSLRVDEDGMWFSWLGREEDGIPYGNGFYFNRTHLTPVPPGARIGDGGTDGTVDAALEWPCSPREGRKLDRACDAAEATAAALLRRTPAVDAGATVPRAEVQPNAPAASLLFASAPPRLHGASFPVAHAPDALAHAVAREHEAPPALPRSPQAEPRAGSPANVPTPAALVAARATDPHPARATPALVAAAAAATALAALAGVPLWRLYKRVQDRDLARQETRAALLAFVREHPGARLQETADAVGVQRNAIVYHARRLARAGALVVRAERHATRFFLPGAEVAPEAPRATLDHPVARRIVLEIARAGPLARRHLRERVRAPPRTVDWHLARLEREGVVAAREGVRGAAFALSEGAREAAIERALAG